MKNKYPIYIPSKGRWESRLTSKALERIKVSYYIVVEPMEYDHYKAVIDPKKILVLPKDNIKLIGARNWIKKHSISNGFSRHWQLDDNIEQFNRLNRNLQVRVTDGAIFRAAEDFTDRYVNVAFSGFQYDFFAKAKTVLPAFALNTRVYSCTLVNNELNYNWRSVYNDDTDVCLRALKDGYCTILFYAFLQQKSQTMTIKGGNTEDLYLIQDGRKKMAEALVKLHPDVARVTWKFGRWQHHVNYKPFRFNKLIKKEGIKIKNGINNYGMKLKNL